MKSADKAGRYYMVQDRVEDRYRRFGWFWAYTGQNNVGVIATEIYARKHILKLGGGVRLGESMEKRLRWGMEY